MESDHVSVTVKSAFCQDDESREGQDLKKKKKKNKRLNKLRSIKLSKSPSLKPSTRRAKSQLRNIVVDPSSDVESSPYSTSSSQFSTFSDARTSVSQKSAPPLIRRSSFKKGVRTLTRMSSKKQTKLLMKISKSEHDWSSVVSPSGSSRSVNSSNAPKMQFQKSARTLTRKASLRPSRVPTKSKRVSMMKHGELAQITDSGVERATCSSALKDHKLADSLQIEHDGTECKVNSAMKVCPFSYCSLHGHRHGNVPPLQRLISIRRRFLRNERNKVVQDRAIRREKRFGKAKKGIQRSDTMVCNEPNEGPISLVEEVEREFSLELNTEIEAKSNVGLGSYSVGEEAKISEASSLAEMPVGEEASYSLSCAKENPNQTTAGNRLECCSTSTELEKQVSETSDTEEDAFAIKHEDAGSNSVCNEHSKDSSELIEENTKGSNTMTTFDSWDEYVETRSKSGSSSESLSELENVQAGADKKEKENMEPDCDAAEKMKLKDQKYVRMWRLMYKHTVKGAMGKVENQIPLTGLDKETEQVGNSQVLIKSNSSQSSQDRAMESVSESYQKDAVNLVQQAFDEILLPEIQELSPDDQSVTSGLRSDEEVFEQGQVNGEERNVKEAKMTSKIGDKSDQKVSKKWSSLKKIFILKRFVKALDKVKRINRGTPRYLPLQPEPEAERVNLRRQMSEERKNTEEWMLDYALQQVVSKLDPAQQRRVAMLVKAFETVLPLPDLNSSPRLRVADRARVDPVQACSRLVAQNGDKPGKETEGEGNCTNAMIEKKLSRGLEPELSIPLSEATDKDQEEQFSAGNVDDLKSSEVIICADHPNSISDKSNSEETLSTCHEALQSGNVQEVRKQINVILSAEPGKAVDDSDEAIKFKSKTIDTVKENRQVFSDSIEPLADSVIARGKVNERSEPEESESDSTSTDASQDTQMEKQSYMRLWGFVYKHMMSSIVIEDGTKLDNESDGKTVDNVKTTQSLPIKDRDVGMKGSAADNERAVLRRIEAIKLIEKAIDDIILPDNQDSSTDGQATGSSDEEPQAEKSLVEGEQFDSDSTLSTNKSSREPSQEEAASYIVRENKERATLSNQGEGKASSEKKMSRNWSNVKKMILLKRFIKAFENARKFNPRGPRFLPLEADPEAEKVNLKHQEMDERKSAEEWMLDYAVQQAVARLTPARKRKVKLLVEAFETVTPTVRA